MKLSIIIIAVEGECDRALLETLYNLTPRAYLVNLIWESMIFVRRRHLKSKINFVRRLGVAILLLYWTANGLYSSASSFDVWQYDFGDIWKICC